MRLSIDVLPEPVGPIIAAVCPVDTVKVIPLKASLTAPGYLNETLRNSTLPVSFLLTETPPPSLIFMSAQSTSAIRFNEAITFGIIMRRYTSVKNANIAWPAYDTAAIMSENAGRFWGFPADCRMNTPEKYISRKVTLVKRVTEGYMTAILLLMYIFVSAMESFTPSNFFCW